MANDVFANGLEIACKAADGKAVASFPDPCFSPPSPSAGWIVIPYANTAYAKDTSNASKTVFISGKPIMKKDVSFFKKSTGDEAAAGPKGVATGVKKGKAYFVSWSMNVKVEGKNVDRHTDKMTHNHGSYPGNTGPWVYLDTANMEDCKSEIKRVDKACGKKKDKKGKIIPESKDWKRMHCKGLGKKPLGIKLDDLKNIKEKAEKALENFNVVETALDQVKQQIVNAVEKKVAIAAIKVAAKKPLQAVLGPVGWAWAVYDVIDSGMDIHDIYKELDKIKAEVSRLKDEAMKFGDKIDELGDAIKNGKTEKASSMMADMQKDIALLDACTRARKCMLTPYGHSIYAKKKGDNRGCCGGQTGHHLIPDSYMKGKCDKYTSGGAPTVCVEGTTQSHGSHNTVHTALEVAMDDNKDTHWFSGDTVKYEGAKDAAVESHKKAFPLSMCKKKCIEAQLEKYRDKACGKDANPELVYKKIVPLPDRDVDGER